MAVSFWTLDISERRFGQLVIGFVALGFLGLLIGGGAAGWVMAMNQQRVGWVNHTYDVERHINGFRIEYERAIAARRGYLLDHDPIAMAAFDAAESAIPQELVELRQLTADNPGQRARLARLQADIARATTQMRTSVTETKAGRGVKAEADFNQEGGPALGREGLAIASDMQAEENRLLALRIGEQKSAVEIFYGVLAASGALLALVAVSSILVILRYTEDLARSRNRLHLLNDNLESVVETRTVDLQRANAEIQRFAYIVSHDLRSPLVNVLGFTAELDTAAKSMSALVDRAEAEAPHILSDEARRAVREDVPEAIGFIRTSTQKMDRLINAILRLSREGRRTITPERLDMDQLAQGVLDSLKQLAEARGAEMMVEKPMPALTSDRVAIEQILSNLVENAVKYLQPGRPGRIRLSGRRSSGRVIYAVTDNGRGIDPKDHDRVFDLFRRSGAQDQPGEGIGLAHVRTLAYRLGGVVSCRSALGEGATFELSLPEVYAGEETK